MASLINKALNYLQLGGEGGGNEFVGKVVRVNAKSYRVVRPLAEGGFSFVFVAQDVVSGRKVALKRLIVPDEQRLQLVKNEIKVMHVCNGCPHMVEYIDSDTVPPRDTVHSNTEVLIAMELCPRSLVHILNDRAEGFAPHDVIHIFEATVLAVAFLHEQRPPIIHRDLKIENLLIAEGGKVKLCDFGSCTTTVMQPETTLQIGMAEEEIQLNTTPQYRAPEMWDLYSRIPIDHRVDLWALGCILYKLCYYRSPLDEGTNMATCNTVLRLPPSGPKAIFNGILEALLSKNPQDRPSARSVLGELQQLKERLGPRLAGECSALAGPIGDSSKEGLGQAKTQVQHKLIGVYRNICSTMHQGMGMAATAMQSHGQGGREEQEVDWTYITPRLVGASVAHQAALAQLQKQTDSSHRSSYFVFNLSGVAYSDRLFGGRVRNVPYPAKGHLGLAQLWELCEEIHAWLLVDRENVAVVHCMMGTERISAVAAAFMVFCGLFTHTPQAFAHICSKAGHMAMPRPSALRQTEHLQHIAMDRGMPQAQPIVIRRIVYPMAPSIGAGGAMPFPVITTQQGPLFNGRNRHQRLSNGSLCVEADQEVVDDFTVIMAQAREGKLLQLCQIPLHSGFLGAGTVCYGLDDMDRPNKALGDGFTVSLEIEISEGALASATQPWKHGLGNGHASWTVCFGSDMEAKRLIGQYEANATAILQQLSPAVPPPLPKRPPPLVGRRASSSPETNNSPPGTQETSTVPNSKSLIDLEDMAEFSQSNILGDHGMERKEVEAEGSLEEQAANPAPPGREGHLLGLDMMDRRPGMSPSLGCVPSYGQFQDGPPLYSKLETIAATQNHGDLLDTWGAADLQPERPENGPQPTAADGSFGLLLDGLDAPVTFRPGTPPLKDTTQRPPLHTTSPVSPVLPMGTSNTGPGPMPQPNYRVSTSHLQQATSSPRQPKQPARNDPFENLTKLVTPMMPQGTPSTPTSPLPGSPASSQSSLLQGNGTSQGPLHCGSGSLGNGSLGEMGPFGRQQPWQQPRGIGQQRQPPMPQPMKQQGSRLNRSTSPKMPATHHVKSPAMDTKGFADLLTEHNFVPTKRDKGPINMNAMRHQQMMVDDVDGSVALSIKVEQWKDGKKGNIRALLSTLQDVLWPDSGWREIPMSQLLKATQVKRGFMKACLIVHPDKVEGTDHDRHANLVFDEINKAYNAFKEQGMPSLG